VFLVNAVSKRALTALCGERAGGPSHEQMRLNGLGWAASLFRSGPDQRSLPQVPRPFLGSYVGLLAQSQISSRGACGIWAIPMQSRSDRYVTQSHPVAPKAGATRAGQPNHYILSRDHYPHLEIRFLFPYTDLNEIAVADKQLPGRKKSIRAAFSEEVAAHPQVSCE